ncbi:DUF2304 domain-containing protein [Bradyrhizobium retamae]|uniref:Uncharacterized protein n=1 Tax=Bradyrhizobium retamae TaxID=1300035 RepID=A0A0R3MPW1_9BRAD|nr:DUF2304 domain-containing protein [Bradyrhizobium retamae]KRR22264.1 hypothetical protein CQ13_29680 [Bradyrhizobium retamae]
MIAQLLLTAFLALVLVYAWSAHRTVPIIGLLASGAALAGLYFVWVPEHATALAAFAGIGRGSDLIVYTWVVISLLIMLNLRPAAKTSLGHVGPKGRGAPDRIAGEEIDANVKSRRSWRHSPSPRRLA